MPDPYQPLENLNNDATKAFITGQNKVTEDYLSSESKLREKIRKTVEARGNFPTSTIPYQMAEKFFMSYKNTGLQDNR